MQAEENICRVVKYRFISFIGSRRSGASYLSIKYIFVCRLKGILGGRKSHRTTRRIQAQNCKDVLFLDLFIDDAFI